MQNDISPQVILEIIQRNKLLDSATILEVAEAPQRSSKHPYKAVFQGNLSILERKVTILLVIDTLFPYSIPFAFIKDPSAFGFIPHIEKDGYICFVEREGTLVNHSSLEALLSETMDLITKTLTAGASGSNRNDFLNEYESYWRNLDGAVEMLSLITLNNVVHLVSEVFFAEKHPVKDARGIFTDNEEVFNRFVLKRYGKECFESKSIRNALYVPLKNPVEPPPYGTFWTIREIEALFSTHLSAENQRELKLILRKMLDKQTFDMFISFVNPDGKRVSFGVTIEIGSPIKAKKKNSLSLITKATCKPLVIKRLDKEILIPRGGGNLDIQDNSVLIIGCGSLGSFIAEEIASAGVLNITLVDPELLGKENIYRHLAGFTQIGHPKVEAIKAIIERQFIHINVHTVKKNAKQFFEENIERIGLNLNRYSLIIVATGDSNVDRYINEYVNTKANCPPTIFTWIEAYGVGGHALLTNNGDQIGCLECLYRDNPAHKESSFIKLTYPSQILVQSLSGCSGFFTPFGAIDARQTAGLATRLAVRVMNGQEAGNPIHSWKGDATIFRSEGKITSERYDNLSDEERMRSRYDYKKSDCTICS